MNLLRVIYCAVGSIVILSGAAVSNAQDVSDLGAKSRTAEDGFYADVQRRAGRSVMSRERLTRRLYADGFQKLDLTLDETDRLVGLLVEQDMLTSSWKSYSVVTKQALIHEPQPAHLSRAKAIDGEIEQMLGVDRLLILQEYQQTLRERFLLRGLDERLSAAAVPLTDDQKDQLMKVLVGERARLELMSRSAGTLEGAENVIKELNANDVGIQRLFGTILTSDQRRIAARHFQMRADGRQKALERYRQQIVTGAPRPIFMYPAE
jgi:hypothetical protein